MKTAQEKIADIIQGERWVAQEHQREFDRRIVQHAVENGLDPVRAVSAPAFVLTAAAIAKCKEGLTL